MQCQSEGHRRFPTERGAGTLSARITLRASDQDGRRIRVNERRKLTFCKAGNQWSFAPSGRHRNASSTRESAYSEEDEAGRPCGTRSVSTSTSSEPATSRADGVRIVFGPMSIFSPRVTARRTSPSLTNGDTEGAGAAGLTAGDLLSGAFPADPDAAPRAMPRCAMTCSTA